MSTIKVIELFAGVGGFRLGLEGPKKEHINEFKIVWSNQWEPSTKTQHASDIYIKRFGEDNHSCDDIENVVKENISIIPNDADLLVGGFPCQDYSVAKTLRQSSGIVGKKGVLWWSIHKILSEKGEDAPKYLMLENVDRLLKSPASQRGRDFAIMLSSLSSLGYAVEWRVINAADYGMPQRRRRVFILAYRKDTAIYKKLTEINPIEVINEVGVFSKSFPIQHIDDIKEKEISKDIVDISENFHCEKNTSFFETAGIMISHKAYTAKVKPKYSGDRKTLAKILVKEEEVPDDFFINEESLEDWKYLKGAKKEPRKSKNGHEYNYSEGSMVFPDELSSPSRTIVTGEGGSAPSRFKHVIKTKSGRYRRLTPIELERLNMFPANHTEGVSDVRRAFFMGNALVVGVIDKLGRELFRQINC